MYYLERACEIIVKARSMGAEMNMISDKACRSFMDDFLENGMVSCPTSKTLHRILVLKSQDPAADFNRFSMQVYSEGYFEMMKRKLCSVNSNRDYWLRNHLSHAIPE